MYSYTGSEKKKKEEKQRIAFAVKLCVYVYTTVLVWALWAASLLGLGTAAGRTRKTIYGGKNWNGRKDKSGILAV